MAAEAAGAAALLIAEVARRSSDTWPEGTGTAVQLSALADRCTGLAESDAHVFADALAALEEKGPQLAARLGAAAAVPLEIAETAADIAEAAVLVAERCDGVLRADAVAAAALAAGASLAAAQLVRANLTVTSDDPRLARAMRAADDARYSAVRALDSGA